MDLQATTNDKDWAQLEQQRLESLAQQIVDRLSERGATAAEVSASVQQGLSTTVRMGEVETLEYSRDRGIGITAYFGQCKGTASSADLSDDSIATSIDQVCDIARFTEADDCAGLADAELMATKLPDLDLWHPWPLEAGDAIELAKQAEATALNFDSLIKNSEGASVSTGASVAAYANSHGFCASRTGTRHSISCAVVADGDEGMQRDYWYDSGRDASRLAEPTTVGRRAAERTVARYGPKGLATTRAPVLFVPETARGLLGHMVAAISGGALYRKSSFLLDQLDKPLFPKTITLRELPFEPRGLRSGAYDAEGVATQERDIVADGILRSYLLSAYSARKLGMSTTGHAGGVRNLTCLGGSGDQPELMATMQRGLIVTELMGQGVNPVTGDYSRGAAGFWVEDGQISYPVDGITIAGNLKDMFANIAAAGSDLDYRGGIRCGSLLIEGMTIAGE